MSTAAENRRRLNESRRRRTSGPNLDQMGANYLLGEFVKMITEGKTPFVSPQDVEREKDRRAQIGLDPDYYTNPLEDLGLMQAAPEVEAGRQERIDDRLEQIQQRDLPPVQAPVETPTQQSTEPETPEAIPPEPQLSFAQQEQQARDAFDAIKNNPAREAGLDPDFLFARHKANLVSKLAKQDVKPADLEGTEQAFLAKQLEKYIGNKRQFNSGRDRGF